MKFEIFNKNSIFKFQKALFVALLILLPTQLGYHFWPEWAFVNGIRVDYFSPTIYLTDILIFLLIVLELKVKRENLKKNLSIKKLLIIFLILLFSLLNIVYSLSPAVSIYKWTKVLEFIFFAWFVKKYIIHNTKYLILLLIPIFYESVLAVWQFFNQGSVGGLWYWLGERAFNAATPGIAHGRPYGTFPHPNVLAGFLIVSCFLVIKYFPQISRKITAGVLVLSLVITFLTLSKGNLLIGWNLRQQLNNIAIQQFSNSPLIGTGLGTSPLYPRNITNYALVHQPIHNIYLLLLSETGILGILGVLGILGKLRIKITLPLAVILFLGFFDHYWLTLQQGQLLLALVIGIII